MTVSHEVDVELFLGPWKLAARNTLGSHWPVLAFITMSTWRPGRPRRAAPGHETRLLVSAHHLAAFRE
ncbi:MAG: hypothetical protein P4L86_13885 [Mycobacterium sp.]|nr:hypothetical protein [Mycobacterium sp.]